MIIIVLNCWSRLNIGLTVLPFWYLVRCVLYLIVTNYKRRPISNKLYGECCRIKFMIVYTSMRDVEKSSSSSVAPSSFTGFSSLQNARLQSRHVTQLGRLGWKMSIKIVGASRKVVCYVGSLNICKREKMVTKVVIYNKYIFFNHPPTLRHCLLIHDCLALPGPPYFFMSLQKLHSWQSSLVQGSHCLHLTRRRLLPAASLPPGLGLGPLREPINLAVLAFCFSLISF